ncbi:MAG TPA: hypothetical protein VH933_16670 [Aestuariivirgaceae bacterium]|jgi:hypothetical protein
MAVVSELTPVRTTLEKLAPPHLFQPLTAAVMADWDTLRFPAARDTFPASAVAMKYRIFTMETIDVKHHSPSLPPTLPAGKQMGGM